MAKHDKDQMNLKDAPMAGKAAAKPDDKKDKEIGYSAQSAAPVVDKAHMKRHDEAEAYDRKLAKQLQASWSKRVADEHKIH